MNGATIAPTRPGRDGVVDVQLLLDNYVAVLLATVMGSILVGTALIGSRVLAPFSSSRQKSTTYECGMLPIGRVRTQVHIRYYLFAILGAGLGYAWKKGVLQWR